jgi:hypothetical protein
LLKHVTLNVLDKHFFPVNLALTIACSVVAATFAIYLAWQRRRSTYLRIPSPEAYPMPSGSSARPRSVFGRWLNDFSMRHPDNAINEAERRIGFMSDDYDYNDEQNLFYK